MRKWAGSVVGAIAVMFGGWAAADEPPGNPPEGPLNVESPTFGGKQFWTDELVFHDWRIQRHAVSGHCRLLDEQNVRRAWGDFDQCQAEFGKLRQEKPVAPLKRQVVLVLHGLVRSRESMDGLCQFLRQSGEFSILNLSYASSRATVSDHAAALAKVVRHLDGVDQVSFVGHSLGNLVVRHYLHDRDLAAGQTEVVSRGLPAIGRVVMLAPPNNGAEMARRFHDNPLFQAIWGTSGRELALQWRELEPRLAIPSCEFGIIAGGTGKQIGRSPFVAGDDDFIVAVEETRLPGAADFLVLPALHGTIMDDAKVQQVTLRFLQTGCFETPATRQPIPRS